MIRGAYCGARPLYSYILFGTTDEGSIMAKDMGLNERALGAAFSGMALLFALAGLVVRGLFGMTNMRARAFGAIGSLVAILVFVVVGYGTGYLTARMYNWTASKR